MGAVVLGAGWGNEEREGEEGAQRGPEKGHWGLRRYTAGRRPFVPSHHSLRATLLGDGGDEGVTMGRRWETEGT